MRSYRLAEMPYGVWYDAGEAALEARTIVAIPYSNTKHYSEMRLFWTPPGRSSETLPTEVLFPSRRSALR